MSGEDVQPPAQPADCEIAVSLSTPNFDSFAFLGTAKEARVGTCSSSPPLDVWAYAVGNASAALQPVAASPQTQLHECKTLQATYCTATTVSARRVATGLPWC